MKVNIKIIYGLLGLLAVLLILSFSIDFFTSSERETTEIANRTQKALIRKSDLVNDFYETNLAKGVDTKFIANVSDLIDQLDVENISMLHYQFDKLTFWSSNRIVLPHPEQIHDGSSFRQLSNGWYFIIKKVKGNNATLFFVPIKSEYSFQNTYLQNEFSRDLAIPSYFKLAQSTDPGAVAVKDNGGKALFYLSIDKALSAQIVSVLEIIIDAVIILLTFILLLLIAHIFFIKKNWALVILFAIVLPVGMRFLMINLRVPSEFYKLELFGPYIYASSYPNNSLGELFLNTLFVFGILWFFERKLKSFKFSVRVKTVAYVLASLLIAIVYKLSATLFFVFQGLIINSRIQFDISHVLDLSIYSFLGLFITAIVLYTFYLFCLILARLFMAFDFSTGEKITLASVALTVVTLVLIVTNSFNIYYLLIAFFLVLIERVARQRRGVLDFPERTIILLIFSILVASNLIEFNNQKEKERRKLVALKLEDANDPIAEFVFNDIRENIKYDKAIANYFNGEELPNRIQLNNHLQKRYFGGYFSRYEVSVYPVTSSVDSLTEENAGPFRALLDNAGLKSFSIKQDTLFQPKGIPGMQRYIAVLNLDSPKMAKLLFDIHSKLVDKGNTFPKLLLEGNVNINKEIERYSYALYNKHKLMSNKGDYLYKRLDDEFNAQLRVHDSYFANLNGYNHLVYKARDNTIIVVSKKNGGFFVELAIFSYILGFSIVFTFLILICRYLFSVVYTHFDDLLRFNFNEVFSSVNILFKTRIQLSMILAVMMSIIVIGWVTLSNVRRQYKEQQSQLINERVSLATASFNSELVENDRLIIDKDFPVKFASFSDVTDNDINLYDTEGNLIISTQPKLFDRGLIDEKIDPKPFYNIQRSGFIEYITEYEKIGKLDYLAAYSPIVNSKNQILGYISLPYFENEEEYRTRISAFLNAIINVYSFVFLAIGIVAFIFSNSITAPLELLLQNFRTTRIGKYTPIEWRGNDEIGNMVKEYNNMIAELEISARKLAMSERENAWREMAKQVAHEIKNPLTPLRLGVQHLDRAWRDKDPNFDQKFEKFSKGFIKQIDSLSFIASEFSSFARMPDTHNEVFDVKEILEETVFVFKETESAEVTFKSWSYTNTSVFADKDQLMRSFNNLVKNALQAMPPETKGMVIIDLTGSDNEVSITISDNGLGIPDDAREKIFSPNFTTKSSGMGIGLAFVKSSIENAGGTIRFNSVAGVGTTFYINLPVVKQFVSEKRA
ncbi:sensor histidine kinase [Solitalea koreensis]|uniref:histidine kinase n=1 Tax=Solitalea koreensis TaxID=543615 RepID=A0A521AZK0_9SPHI|nr:HAMP domain-containing sensor histidine kinase [Solitalea koreensis]SMO39950.1 Histidine kinase-, DNA gyrase B-, and HSP90-like ATPase [Solitalea koreensis]